MNRFTADLRQLDNLNVNLLTFRRVPAAPRRKFDSFERTALKAALSVGKSFDSKLALMDDVVSVGESPPAVTVLRPATLPVGVAISKSLDLTVAFGVGGGGFVIFGAVGSVGLYASTTREIGGFFTVGAGLSLPTVGASGGGELDFVLGTPTDFRGFFLQAGVSVSPAVLGVGASLLFVPGPPLTFMGVSVSLTANTPSVVPVSFTIVTTNTKIKPFVRF